MEDLLSKNETVCRIVKISKKKTCLPNKSKLTPDKFSLKKNDQAFISSNKNFKPKKGQMSVKKRKNIQALDRNLFRLITKLKSQDFLKLQALWISKIKPVSKKKIKKLNPQQIKDLEQFFELKLEKDFPKENLYIFFKEISIEYNFYHINRLWAGLLIFKIFEKIPKKFHKNIFIKCGLKLYCTCLMIAQKILDDVGYTWKDLSKLFEIDKKDLSIMESFLLVEVFEFELNFPLKEGLKLWRCFLEEKIWYNKN